MSTGQAMLEQRGITLGRQVVVELPDRTRLRATVTALEPNRDELHPYMGVRVLGDERDGRPEGSYVTRTIEPIEDVEAKGRNGYFKVARAVTFVTEDGKYADICFYSKRQGDSAPLIIKGEPAALKALLGLLYNSI